MIPLLATKLRCPPAPPRQLQRPRLVARLHAGLAAGRPLTLVSAPAGFGKTTCVGSWVGTLACPVAWLSLEATAATLLSVCVDQAGLIGLLRHLHAQGMVLLAVIMPEDGAI